MVVSDVLELGSLILQMIVVYHFHELWTTQCHLRMQFKRISLSRDLSRDLSYLCMLVVFDVFVRMGIGVAAPSAHTHKHSVTQLYTHELRLRHGVYSRYVDVASAGSKDHGGSEACSECSYHSHGPNLRKKANWSNLASPSLHHESSS